MEMRMELLWHINYKNIFILFYLYIKEGRKYAFHYDSFRNPIEMYINKDLSIDFPTFIVAQK